MGDTMKCERYRRATLARKAVEAYLAEKDFHAVPGVAA
jgi:hypothetical protein